MKKSSFYRSTAAAVVAVMTAGALSFTSCETFDDSQIQSSLDDLNSRVETIEEQLAALQGDVDALKTLLDGGKVINSITSNADGTEYTITYVGENVEPDVITVGTSEPVITYIEDNGTLYWAIVNSDGEAEYILGEKNNKIPVESADPKMKVAESGELQISIDGGSKWVNTGVSDTDICVFSKVEQDIENGVVIFTLADGETTFTVPMTTELTCEFLSGKTYFAYGDTKKLSVIAGGFYNYEISAPFGWTAVLSGNTVEVTAPDALNEMTVVSGEVILRVYDNKGAVIMDKVTVAIEGATEDDSPIIFSTSIDASNEPVIRVSVMGSSIFCGAMATSEFSVEKAAEAANSELNLPEDEDGKYLYNMEEWDSETQMMYIDIPFANLVNEPVAGTTYVIWAVPTPYDNPEVLSEDIVTFMFAYGHDVNVTTSDTAFDDILVSLTPTGTTEYYYGVAEKDYFMPEMAINEINPMWGEPMETTSGNVSFKLSEIAESAYIQIVPGSTYLVWTVIKNPDPNFEYTVEEVNTAEFTLSPITLDGTQTVEFGEVTTTTTSVSVAVTAPEGYYAIYGKYMSDEEYKTTTDDEIRKDLIANPYSTMSPNYLTTETNLNPDTKGWFVAVLVDSEGKAGPLVKVAADTNPVILNETITIEGSIDNIKYFASENIVQIPLDIVGGGAASIIYYHQEGPSYDYKWSGDIEQIVANAPTSYMSFPFDEFSISEFETAGKILEIQCWSYQAESTFRFVGFVLDENKQITKDYVTFDYIPSNYAVTE